jgi:hypothetical protein
MYVYKSQCLIVVTAKMYNTFNSALKDIEDTYTEPKLSCCNSVISSIKCLWG